MGTSLAWAIAGGFIAALAVAGLYALLEPASLADGQFLLALVFAYPAGMSVAFAMASRTSWLRTNPGFALALEGAISVAIVVGVLLFTIGSAGSRDESLSEAVRTLMSPWAVVPLLAALIGAADTARILAARRRVQR